MTNPTTALPPPVRHFRDRYRATEIGPAYRGWLHVAFTAGGSVAAIVWACHRVAIPSLAEWATLPATFVVANVVEYAAHRWLMHRPRPPLGVLYRRHTLEHHHFFTSDAMAYESSRDFKMVLFPPTMLLFFLGGIALPLAALLFVVATANVAWLFVAAAMAYFASYEALHFAYHLPEDGWLARRRVVQLLRRHHQLHHDKARMGRWNFNVNFPLADLLFGTYHVPAATTATPPDVDATDAGGVPGTRRPAA
jgi:sterol desaturase/sphingolipid hydroxylase (fatty acid hydroxylase superfamily)